MGNAATNPLQCLQERPHSRHLTQNSIGLHVSKKTGFRTENIVLIMLLLTSTRSTRRLPLSLSFYFHFSLYPSQPLESASCRPKSWWLSLLHSVYHSIRSSEVDMLCFRSSNNARSVVQWQQYYRDASSTTFARDTQSFCVRWVLPPIGMICNMCCSVSDIHSSRSGIRDVVVREGENSIWPGR